ncbi:hypothetical protein [Cohnella faecalis]|uniref:Uncharacterized protein n=1 Tax=Cohnella faecalis TaxID=2315694 RepID=A0A398CIY5_9BACL|nr:hypothetical protein D3H35_12735 [Cohnella faecalis]
MNGCFLWQLVDSGIPTIDIGFPARYSHSAVEVCDMQDLEQLPV